MNRRPTNHSRPLSRLVGLLAVFALIAAACSEDLPTEALPASDEGQIELDAVDGEPAASTSTSSATPTTVPTTTTLGLSEFAGTRIEVAVVGHPTMDLIQALTEEFFTEPTGIEVRFTTLGEQTLREIVTLTLIPDDIDFDVVMIGPFEAPQFGSFGWLQDLSPQTAEDDDYDLDDFIAALLDSNSAEHRGNDGLFAVPFYAESSMIMFNQQIMDDAGIDFPEAPTWEEVADIARQVHTDDTPGICLRGQPGWGDSGASLTTVVNTFGGTWWEANDDGTPGEPQINQPDSAFRAATEFYLDLAADAGPENFTENSLPQCLELFQNGDVAIWYDSTAAAPLLEATDSPIAGNVGYARAPIVETDASAWLWTWGLTVPPERSQNPDAGWEFIRWATSPDTIRLMADIAPDGWNDPAVIGAATRTSHFDIPQFREATEPYRDIVLAELNAADPNNPGTTPRPGQPGVQYVGIPEFQAVGTYCTTELSASAAGTITIDEALDNCQAIAQEVTTLTTTTRPDLSGTTIQVAVVDHPTMDLIQSLTEEFFTGPTGITVEFINLGEPVTLREFVVFDLVGDAPEDEDVFMIGPFESTQFGVNGWLSPFSDDDVDYNLDDFIPSLLDSNTPTDRRGDEVFAVPFYAESSMIMFNQQIMEDAGIDFPEAPTWQEVADIARQFHSDDTTGICMRGIPEWDELGAALTTVVNTFGGTWWEAHEDGTPSEARINQSDSGFRTATEFYLELARDAGPANFTETGFDQCLEQFQNGNVAIWYDTTAAAPLLEAADSPITGNVGYSRAPIAQTGASAALWTWGFAVGAVTREPDASWEFIRWATSPETISLMAEHAPGGWNDPAVIGAATRTSHFELPEFREATEPYGDIVLAELTAADPNNPGTTPRPGRPGVQFVGILEFQQVATDCSAEFATAVEGWITIDDALDNCQTIAQEVADEYE